MAILIGHKILRLQYDSWTGQAAASATPDCCVTATTLATASHRKAKKRTRCALAAAPSNQCGRLPPHHGKSVFVPCGDLANVRAAFYHCASSDSARGAVRRDGGNAIASVAHSCSVRTVSREVT